MASVLEPATSQGSASDLAAHGLRNLAAVHWNLRAAPLLEQALVRHEGMLAANGALVVRTGQFTGRSPQDKYIVRDAVTEGQVHWGRVNQPMEEAAFDGLLNRLITYLEGQELFVEDTYAGADPAYRLPVRAITQKAWHALFARQLLIRPGAEELRHFRPEFTLFFVPDFHSDPKQDGVRSETCIAINFRKRLVIIAGTMYAGELKKCVFTILNFLLPQRGVLPMHCSANTDTTGNTALFFGLSGTGKTTLSADISRQLIGDDEHGWTETGIFNFEGGCYAKCIRLSREKEPQIWDAIRFGAVLENVAMDVVTRELNYDSDEFTENTRAAYPVEFIANARIPGLGSHPRNIVFLTADAFGVLPPLAKLSTEQAMYHFLSGYTSRLAGTERGLGKEPIPSFSACFGEPFLPLHPKIYAQMLGEKLRRHHVQCWLVNTGWIRGPYGSGERIPLAYTRAMIHAAIQGQLEDAPIALHPTFGLHMPQSCPGVPAELLNPRNLWSDKEVYDRTALQLASRFRENFQRFGEVEAEIAAAGPQG